MRLFLTFFFSSFLYNGMETREVKTKRKIFSCIIGILLPIMSAVEVSAAPQTGIIYIKEDGIDTVVNLLVSMFLCTWKEIAAVCAAAVCLSAMLILTRKGSKRGK